ncbi:MAG TPA: SDR family NAD(P)-dependent oxidoreductase [Streptosporangiaceae bacterium]|nr:SDR family NAD(P)-dependent oxidoreductase [Streptosporangiaceae bacterium]
MRKLEVRLWESADTEDAIARLGGVATGVAADLRDPGAVQGLVDRAMTDTGRLDLMVNNAGVSFQEPLADGDPEAWREMLEVNVLALAIGSQAAIRAMRACGAQGHIVNVSSSATRLEAPGFYGATKTAVNAISATLRQELENDPIRVVTVIPGPTATNLARYRPELLRGLVASVGEDMGPPSEGLYSQEALDGAAAVAGQVLASADDVARAVLFAISQPIDVSISEITVQPDRLVAMAAAWFGTYSETIDRSPHAAELLDAKHRLSADLVAETGGRYKQLVSEVLTEAVDGGQLDLASVGLTPDKAAELLIASACGLHSSAASPADYLSCLDALVRVVVAGLARA